MCDEMVGFKVEECTELVSDVDRLGEVIFDLLMDTEPDRETISNLVERIGEKCQALKTKLNLIIAPPELQVVPQGGAR